MVKPDVKSHRSLVMGSTLSCETLAVLEEVLGSRLPDDYRRFLLKTSGHLPRGCTVDVPGLLGGGVDVQTFFGVNRSVETSNII
jgi:hypothetical protein